MAAIIQDTFNQYASIGYHGQLNKSYPNWVATLLAEVQTAIGVAVTYGDNAEKGVVMPADADAADFVGITLRTQAGDNTASATPEPVYDVDRSMSIVKKGQLYLVVEEGSTRNAPVYFVPGTGVITSDAAAGANIAIPRARFVRDAAAGEVTEIELA